MTTELNNRTRVLGVPNFSIWIWLALPIMILVVILWTTSVDRRDAIPVRAERTLIVGASSGIGRSIALQYAARGAMVAVMGRRERELEAVKTECEIHGSRVLSVVGDFEDVDTIMACRASVEQGMFPSKFY